MSFKEQERGQKPQTLIERLRTEHPDENIITLGVDLKNPVDMRTFFFQYADELRRSPLEIVRNHPFDTAASHIRNSANYAGRDAVTRWQEVLSTGTMQNTPDISDSLNWLTGSGTQTRFEEVKRSGKVSLPVKPRDGIKAFKPRRNESGTIQPIPRSSGADIKKVTSRRVY